MSNTSSFDYLQSLGARCREGFTALPSARDKLAITWSGVGFRLGDQYCVTAMDDIAEVLTEPAVTRLPGVKPWVKGVANVRGRLLPLVDLTAFIGERIAVEQRHRRVLVIEKGEIYLGLIVDDVFGMQHFNAETYRLDCDVKDTHLANYVQGAYQHGQRQWLVFRPVQLIEDDNFYTVAA
ncbi:MAG: twitching motility protein PilI [Zhongshania sp.]|jgi:twitching motility protein PilI|nr:purine-binding chemotaxis protein CheW [Zhongshania sp.]